jgi:hypothetical protein
LIAGLVRLEATAARTAKFFVSFASASPPSARPGWRSSSWTRSSTPTGKAYNKLSLNGFLRRRINHDKTLVDGKVPVHCFENFRGYAKRRLKSDHGGFTRSFRLFIRE